MEEKKAENGQRGGLLPRVHRKQTVKECFHRSLLKTGGVLVSARLIMELKRPIIQFSRLVFAHLSRAWLYRLPIYSSQLTPLKASNFITEPVVLGCLCSRPSWGHKIPFQHAIKQVDSHKRG